jgi:glucokinase
MVLGAGATLGVRTLIAFVTARAALDGEGATGPFSAAPSRHIGTPRA